MGTCASPQLVWPSLWCSSWCPEGLGADPSRWLHAPARIYYFIYFFKFFVHLLIGGLSAVLSARVWWACSQMARLSGETTDGAAPRRRLL